MQGPSPDFELTIVNQIEDSYWFTAEANIAPGIQLIGSIYGSLFFMVAPWASQSVGLYTGTWSDSDSILNGYTYDVYNPRGAAAVGHFLGEGPGYTP